MTILNAWKYTTDHQYRSLGIITRHMCSCFTQPLTRFKMLYKCASNLSLLFLLIIVFIFLCLDLRLYQQIQHESRFNITITVKAVMLDHVNCYLLQPLSEWIMDTTHLLVTFPSVTANQISFLGLAFAFLSARLVFSERLFVRRAAVLAFFARQFFDDLDGFVARYRSGIDAKKQVTIPHTSGYLVDGICDGVGFVVLWFAVFLFWYNRQTNKSSNVLLSHSTYTLLHSSDYHCNKNGDKNGSNSNLSSFGDDDNCENDGGGGSGINNSNNINTTATSLASIKPTTITYYRRRLIKYYLLVLIQMGMSSLFWNIFLVKYHHMLDPSLNSGFDTRTPLQQEIFKSSLMFTIMWCWRCLNPHAITNYFLIAIWLNCPTQYARQSSKYICWIILGLSFLCEVHFQDIKYRLDMKY